MMDEAPSPVVGKDDLVLQGSKLLKKLLDTLKAPLPSSVALVSVSALADLAVKRHEHAPYLVDALV